MSKGSILEQALLQVNTLEEAVKQNAKGILASTMKQELTDLLKEAEEDEENPFEKNDDLPTDGEEDVTGENPGDEVNDEEPDNDADDLETDYDDLEGDEDLEGGEEVPEFGDEPEGDEDLEGEPEDDTLDMTGASDEEVVKVFRAMKPEDGIVVKKDGNKIDLNVDGEDYIIKLDEQHHYQAEEVSEEDDDTEEGDVEEGDETIYEIELDDEGDDEYKNEYGDNWDKSTHVAGHGFSNLHEGVDAKIAKWKVAFEKKNGRKPNKKETDKFTAKCNTKEGDVEESARTFGNGWRNGVPKTKFKTGRKDIPAEGGTSASSKAVPTNPTRTPLKGLKINEEVETLRKQNAEYKKALILFKDKLNEVAVFNANLAYATRLFTEHSTTKQEKLGILKRFDTISTINESKNLYGQIKTELEFKKPITESVAEKISPTPKSTGSTEVLSESKAYENPQFKRMKELMKKL